MTEAENQLEPKDGRPFTNGDRLIVKPAERHGCVTTWLVLMLFFSSIATLIYLVVANKPIHIPKVSQVTAYCFIILAALNIIFSIQLLLYKKVGFYGFVITTIIGFFLNISIGISPVAPFLGLSGIAILYGILHIKKNGISTWKYLH